MRLTARSLKLGLDMCIDCECQEINAAAAVTRLRQIVPLNSGHSERKPINRLQKAKILKLQRYK
jgi:hypothetical protein